MSTDLQALGRLGQPFATGRARSRRRPITRRQEVLGYTARRRALLPAPLRALLAVGAVLGIWVLIAAALQDGPLPAEPVEAALPLEAAAAVPSRAELFSAPARSRAGGAAPTAVAVAEVGGVDVVLPHPQPVLVAFHEASRDTALGLTPLGARQVLSSRGRGTSPTSAVDVVLPAGARVRATVTGTVVEVREYALYGETRDFRVVIAPESDPDLEVVAIHLLEPEVEEGDVVVAGETPLAEVRRLPFESHVDALYRSADEPRLPYSHLEVREAAASELDLDAPAVELEHAADR